MLRAILALCCIFSALFFVSCVGGGSGKSQNTDLLDQSEVSEEVSVDVAPDTEPDTVAPDTVEPDTAVDLVEDTVCVPSCNLKQCGDDRCGTGGICGTCPPTTQCNADQQCELIPSECEGKANGTACTVITNGICMSGNCAPSYCGDGFVNTAGGEECDDNNVVPGDGCDPPLCTYGCINAGDCPNDADDCNGTSTCNTATHVCQTSAPLSVNAPCVIAGNTGTCQGFGAAVVCIAAGCGNNVLDAGEECDDGNVVSGDGCDPGCVFTCKTNVDCDDGNACNGLETCFVASHTCNAGTAPDCNTNDPCSVDTCDPNVGCVHTQIDVDGDLYSPKTLTCAAINGFVGGDCNDNKIDVNPGQSEVCNNGIDDDCNGTVDDGQTKWWADCDKDGYAASNATSTTTCTSPTIPTGCNGQWVTRNPQNNPDCCDTDARAFPGASAWRTYVDGPKTCGGWDYNCNGTARKQYTGAYDQGACNFSFSSYNNGCSLTTGAAGWAGTEAACGTPPLPWFYGCQGGFPSCAFQVTMRVQGCD